MDELYASLVARADHHHLVMALHHSFHHLMRSLDIHERHLHLSVRLVNGLHTIILLVNLPITIYNQDNLVHVNLILSTCYIILSLILSDYPLHQCFRHLCPNELSFIWRPNELSTYNNSVLALIHSTISSKIKTCLFNISINQSIKFILRDTVVQSIIENRIPDRKVSLRHRLSFESWWSPIRTLCHIRPLVDQDTANTIACSLVCTRLDYCNAILYGVTKQNIDRLQHPDR